MATPTPHSPEYITPEDLNSILSTPINIIIDPQIVSSITSQSPFLPIPTALNLRTITAQNLKSNFLFRSGTLSHLPPPVLKDFTTQYNISTIFDLRSPSEVASSPDPAIEGVEIIVVSEPTTNEGREIRVEDFIRNDGVDAWVAIYLDIMRNTHAVAFRTFFAHLLTCKGNILFHCTAGKDRTGVLSALIFMLVDATREEISLDYMLTRVGIEPGRAMLIRQLEAFVGREVEGGMWEVPGMPALCGMCEGNVVGLVAGVEGVWRGRGVDGYMAELGFGREQMRRIRRVLRGEVEV
ncbi:(Phosphotyrosine protein) phosphatases II [Glarea lozoyensis ATCC 20868]|uniref:(Phosphotyrosine protein) phosphatases II n=1 Tax=Glarea lozoyensis (strain ATCC 20868 / MF5171) TaxID=1116229 RepID=S3DAE1_GLAL2|nr:(Phosphotyrosine protein) phosphatases II [Glarea lozoyensis ATCC 20868]EPE35422.1 (Phosphotyrosine protein) phosphatases II [Glarea lozoyensis ATCC 20868]